MKSQDIGLLLKLLAMEISEKQSLSDLDGPLAPSSWTDWDFGADTFTARPSQEDGLEPDYTARGLEMETGISKTQINLSLKRSIDVGLAFKDRKNGFPRANARTLFDFIVYGLRYVFPVRKGELTRGIGTAFSAPMLRDKLFNAGELDLVWPDAYGKTKGQAIEPLFKTAPHAVKRDPVLYHLLALVDAIRLGQPRERNLAVELLEARMIDKA